MRILRRSFLLLSFGAFSAALAFDVAAQGPGDWAPSKLEVFQLPRFCWGQMHVPDVQGPEFGIHDCGPYANHYCFGLTYLMRAKGWTGKGKPTAMIARADTDIAYTEGGIKDYPQCSIRDHVAGTRVEINQLMRMYGMKPPQRR